MATVATLAIAPFGCAAATSNVQAPPPPLHLSPLTDLAPAAGLTWLIDAHPRDIAADASLLPVVAELISQRELDQFAQRNAVDAREIEELVIAQYPATNLLLLRAVIDPAKLATAFAARVLEIEGRAQDHAALGDPRATIIRTWGTLAASHDRAQLATFGLNAAGLEVGKLGPLRAAELFAEEKLRRASPALNASPLKDTLDKLGNEPAALRAFAPGPFEGESSTAFGGLLRGATAAAIAVRVAHANARPMLTCRLVLTGAWGADAAAAADRLGATFHVLATSPSGKLLALDSYGTSPRAEGTADALTLEVTYDAETLARALHLATAGTLEQLLSSGATHPD